MSSLFENGLARTVVVECEGGMVQKFGEVTHVEEMEWGKFFGVSSFFCKGLINQLALLKGWRLFFLDRLILMYVLKMFIYY